MEIRRDVFQAIADPTRRLIINLIDHQSMNLNAITDNFDISRPAISNHIKILHEFVELEKIFSSANLKPMTEGVEIQALFQENGDKTNFTFNVVHPTEEYCKQQEKMGFYSGWGSAFDRLETLMSTVHNE